MSTFKGFTSVQLRRPPRSKFDLGHEKRLSTRMGKLTPVLITETMPNDTFRGNTEVLLRLAPLLAPLMHRVNVFVHHFFVPNRLLWKDWEKFITGGRLGTETPPVPPNSNYNSVAACAAELFNLGGLWDYFGGLYRSDAQCVTLGDKRVDLMPFAAYYKVWYDYFRDRNYVADNDLLPMASGDHSADAVGFHEAMFTIRYRDWQKDYFTSALPWTQRGDEVLMPLAGTGSVTYLPTSSVYTTAGGVPGANSLIGNTAANNDMYVGKTAFGASGPGTGRVENIDEINITTSDVSINDLRQALRLQEWLERNALAGSRYSESIMAHFGRRTSDGRLQRAEYLGGGRVNVRISEVVTTAFSEDSTAETVPAGHMAGHGVVLSENNSFSYNCEEHGFVISLLSVMPTSGYMQGIPRMFLERNTFLDYPWPSFAHLGEQPVYNYELFAEAAAIPTIAERGQASVFGYQSRYADWKYIASSSHGDFRSSLNFWHMTRVFAGAPVLGADFCTFEDELQDRVFAVSEVDTLWCYIYNNLSVVRALPYFGTPML